MKMSTVLSRAFIAFIIMLSCVCSDPVRDAVGNCLTASAAVSAEAFIASGYDANCVEVFTGNSELCVSGRTYSSGIRMTYDIWGGIAKISFNVKDIDRLSFAFGLEDDSRYYRSDNKLRIYGDDKIIKEYEMDKHPYYTPVELELSGISSLSITLEEGSVALVDFGIDLPKGKMNTTGKLAERKTSTDLVKSAFLTSSVTPVIGAKEISDLIVINGRGYSEGFILNSVDLMDVPTLAFNVENIDSLSFKYGYTDQNGNERDSDLTIYADNEVIKEIEVGPHSLLQELTIDTTAYKIIRIRTNWDYSLGLVDFSFNGKATKCKNSPIKFSGEKGFLENIYHLHNGKVYDGINEDNNFVIGGKTYTTGLELERYGEFTVNCESFDNLSFLVYAPTDTKLNILYDLDRSAPINVSDTPTTVVIDSGTASVLQFVSEDSIQIYIANIQTDPSSLPDNCIKVYDPKDIAQTDAELSDVSSVAEEPESKADIDAKKTIPVWLFIILLFGAVIFIAFVSAHLKNPNKETPVAFIVGILCTLALSSLAQFMFGGENETRDTFNGNYGGVILGAIAVFVVVYFLAINIRSSKKNTSNSNNRPFYSDPNQNRNYTVMTPQENRKRQLQEKAEQQRQEEQKRIAEENRLKQEKRRQEYEKELKLVRDSFNSSDYAQFEQHADKLMNMPGFTVEGTGLPELTEELINWGSPEARKTGRRLAKKLMDKGSLKARGMYALCLRDGIGGKSDPKQAREIASTVKAGPDSYFRNGPEKQAFLESCDKAFKEKKKKDKQAAQEKERQAKTAAETELLNRLEAEAKTGDPEKMLSFVNKCLQISKYDTAAEYTLSFLSVSSDKARPLMRELILHYWNKLSRSRQSELTKTTEKLYHDSDPFGTEAYAYICIEYSSGNMLAEGYKIIRNVFVCGGFLSGKNELNGLKAKAADKLYDDKKCIAPAEKLLAAVNKDIQQSINPQSPGDIPDPLNDTRSILENYLNTWDDLSTAAALMSYKDKRISAVEICAYLSRKDKSFKDSFEKAAKAVLDSRPDYIYRYLRHECFLDDKEAVLRLAKLYTTEKADARQLIHAKKLLDRYRGYNTAGKQELSDRIEQLSRNRRLDTEVKELSSFKENQAPDTEKLSCWSTDELNDCARRMTEQRSEAPVLIACYALIQRNETLPLSEQDLAWLRDCAKAQLDAGRAALAMIFVLEYLSGNDSVADSYLFTAAAKEAEEKTDKLTAELTTGNGFDTERYRKYCNSLENAYKAPKGRYSRLLDGCCIALAYCSGKLGTPDIPKTAEYLDSPERNGVLEKWCRPSQVKKNTNKNGSDAKGVLLDLSIRERLKSRSLFVFCQAK